MIETLGPSKTHGAADINGLELLVGVLSLGFRNPKYHLDRTDTGVPYAHLTDDSLELSIIISQDDGAAVYRVDNYGRHTPPDLEGPTLGGLATALAHRYQFNWQCWATAAAALIWDASLVV